ncbi:MAG TPA: hypothetical protein VGJ15_02145 [Pirellulales bacterium]
MRIDREVEPRGSLGSHHPYNVHMMWYAMTIGLRVVGTVMYQ